MRPVRCLPGAHPIFYFPPCGEDHDSKVLCTAIRITPDRLAEKIIHFAGAEPDVVIRVRRSVVQVQIEHPGIGFVVEVAAT